MSFWWRSRSKVLESMDASADCEDDDIGILCLSQESHEPAGADLFRSLSSQLTQQEQRELILALCDEHMHVLFASLYQYFRSITVDFYERQQSVLALNNGSRVYENALAPNKTISYLFHSQTTNHCSISTRNKHSATTPNRQCTQIHPQTQSKGEAGQH